MKHFLTLIFIFLNIYSSKAQVNVLDTRMWTPNDSISQFGYFCTFFPSFHYIKIPLLPYNPRTPDQGYRSFRNADGSIGYTQGGLNVYYNHTGYNLSWNWDELRMQANSSVYHLVPSVIDSNSFFLIRVKFYGVDNRSFLMTDKFTVNADNTISMSPVYVEEVVIHKNTFLSYYGGLLTRDSKGGIFLHTLNATEKLLRTYRFDAKTGDLALLRKLTMGDTFPLKYFDASRQDVIPTQSADNKLVVLNSETINRIPDGVPTYFYRITDGQHWEFLKSIQLGTFISYFMQQPSGIMQARLSPTGRYLYGVDATQVPVSNGSSITKVLDTVRLVRYDIGGVSKPDYKPKVKILKEWYHVRNSGIGNTEIQREMRISIQSFAPDGKIYFQWEERYSDSQNHVSSSTMYRINDPDAPDVSWDKNVEKMIDSMPFMTYFYRNDPYDTKTWPFYPYHAFGDTVCMGTPSTLRFHSTLPYDSIRFEADGHPLVTLKAGDSSVRYLFATSGYKQVACHVFTDDFEDVVYTDVGVLTDTLHDSLRTLPFFVYGCNGDTLTLDPGIDGVAISAKWSDGYPHRERTITHTDTVVWLVQYDSSGCPRADIVIAHLKEWDSTALPDFMVCDRDSIRLMPTGSQSYSMVWDNGDTAKSIVVTKSGRYCVTLYDSFSHCEQTLCSDVTFEHSSPPRWDKLDTTLCKGETLVLDIDSNYRVQMLNSPIISGPAKLKIKDTGELVLLFSEKGCDWKHASITLHYISNDSCNLDLCQWYVPNIINPESFNEKNKVFRPISGCADKTSYMLTIYNRWGERIYAGNEGWDGKFKGQLCVDGVYFYLLDLNNANGSRSHKKGTVTVLR